MFTMASFFAGVGGIDLGFHATGKVDLVYANEFDPYPIQTFEKISRFPSTLAILNKYQPQMFQMSILLRAGSRAKHSLLRAIARVFATKKDAELSSLNSCESFTRKNRASYFWKM